MDNIQIIDFLRSNIVPLEDQAYGLSYRASVYLKDGTYLPCVVFRNPKKKIDQAIKRFQEENSGNGIFWNKSKDGYRKMVKLFVTKGNKINDYDIERVEKSPFAIPIDILSTIEGETTMAWTGFVAKMKDGKAFSFGTSFLFEFFQMPSGYSGGNIAEILNHSYISKSGNIEKHKVPFIKEPKDYDINLIYRERPFFECYIDTL